MVTPVFVAKGCRLMRHIDTLVDTVHGMVLKKVKQDNIKDW